MRNSIQFSSFGELRFVLRKDDSLPSFDFFFDLFIFGFVQRGGRERETGLSAAFIALA